MRRLALTHKIRRFSEINPSNPNPVTFESKEERYILPTGGEERIVETDAFHLQSGKQAMPEDILVKCRECGGITDTKGAFECTGCHRMLCRDHLKKEEVIARKEVQKQNSQGLMLQYEQDIKQRFCNQCWRKEAFKRTVKWALVALFSPLMFLRHVLQDDDGQVAQVKEIEDKQSEDCDAENAAS